MVAGSLALLALLAGPGRLGAAAGAHGHAAPEGADLPPRPVERPRDERQEDPRALHAAAQVGRAPDSSALIQLRGDGDVADDLPIHPTTKGRTSWGGDLIVYPAKKLVFCTIPKNACTQFMRIFLGFNNKVKDAKTWDDWFNMVTLHSMGMSRDDVSRAKGYKWAVFLRDPLARYLSAWGSKCWQKEDTWNCVGNVFSKTGSVEDFEKHVLAVSRNPGKLWENAHWAPQQSQCGGLKNASDYDFVGSVDGGTNATNAQVHAMLKMVGAPEDEVDAEFPKGAVARHHTSLDMDVYYRNETIRRMVKDFYRSDYDLPGLA